MQGVQPTTLQPRRITIDGTTYSLRRWAFEDAFVWMHRILATVPAVLEEKSDSARLGKLLKEFGLAQFQELWSVVARHTDVVGKEGMVALPDIAAVHMQGRLFDAAKLIAEHLTQEYAPFLPRLREIVGTFQKGTSG